LASVLVAVRTMLDARTRRLHVAHTASRVAVRPGHPKTEHISSSDCSCSVLSSCILGCRHGTSVGSTFMSLCCVASSSRTGLSFGRAEAALAAARDRTSQSSNLRKKGTSQRCALTHRQASALSQACATSNSPPLRRHYHTMLMLRVLESYPAKT